MTTHAAVAAGLKNHPIKIAKLVCIQAAARLLALSPLLLPFLFPDRFSKGIFSSKILPFLLSALAYLLGILPLRFHGATQLMNTVAPKNAARFRPCAYPTLVLDGLIRVTLGFLWGIPFFVFVYHLYLYTFEYDLTALGSKIAKAVSFLPFSDSQIPLIFCIVLAFLLSSALLLYGWHRGTAFDFTCVNQRPPRNSVKQAMRIRKRCKKQLFKNAWFSVLLFCPALLISVLVFVLFCGGASKALSVFTYTLATGIALEPAPYLFAIAAFLLLDLSLLPYRKARNAAVVIAYAEDE